jgi:hypothetical protein
MSTLFSRWLRLLSSASRSAKRPPRRTARNKRAARKIMLEQLEDRTLLSAWVQTDRTDYLPLTAANITGGEWLANETVQLRVVRTDTSTLLADWQAGADGSGRFQTSWNVGDNPGAPFQLTATGLTSGSTAQVAFTDGTVTDIQGWENKLTVPAWGGTLQGNNSSYSESGWVPYRFVDTNGEVAGSSHTLVLKYDFTDSQGVHFIDSLGSYNNTITSGADPASGVTGAGSPTTFSIPVDPSLPSGVQNLYGTASTHLVTAYNVSSLSFGSYSLASGQKAITLTYTVAAGTGNKNVVIAFGGHLANDNDWGGAGKGASSFPGGSGKVYASLDSGSFGNASLNPGQVVTNAAPLISSTNSSVTVNEGQTATNTGAWSDSVDSGLADFQQLL